MVGEKTDEYQRIIRSLLKIKTALGNGKKMVGWKRDSPKEKLSAEEIKEMRASMEATIENIRITAMVGSFYISQEAVKALEDMLVGLDKIKGNHQGNDIETYGDEYKLIKKTISRIRECGKKN